MTEFKANKAGRRPFPIGTLVDVILREGQCYHGEKVSQRVLESGKYAGHLEVIGAVVGSIHDWKIDNVMGDVLAYRKHEGVSNEQG